MPNDSSIDALLPPEMAAKAELIGVKKANMSVIRLFVLSVLAGAFIALGAVFATTAVAGSAGHMPYGVTRVLAGVVFSLGLILVIVGGAELFTGNNLIVMAWANCKVSTGQLLRNWGIVYIGNFVGAFGIAVILFQSGQYTFGNSTVGSVALNTAQSKVHIGFTQAICLGMLCNVLVCLAIWLAFSARTTTDRILAIVPPIAAFVAAGFEHSIANMYFIPIGILIKSGASPDFWDTIGKSAGDYSDLTWSGFVWNLVPVTIGNIIGGAMMVGVVYWFVYLRKPSTEISSYSNKDEDIRASEHSPSTKD